MTVSSRPEQLPLQFDIRPALEREDFLVAACNAAAVEAIDRWDAWRSGVLVLSGPAGSGKSHLAHVFAAKSGASIHSYGALTDELVEQLAAGPSRVVVEGADMAGEETRLFHLFNAVRQSGGRLLITGRSPPRLWPVALPDLKSRLTAAPAVAIEAPDDAMMEAVVVKMFADRQVSVPPDTVSYALKRMPRSFAAARLLVEEADRLALAEKRAVTVPLIRAVLERDDIWVALSER